MKLNYIKDEVCPQCGSPTVQESLDISSHSWQNSKILEHCNGGRWETRKFLCGCELKFIPNYNRVEVRFPCPKTPLILARNKKRKVISKKILSFIGTLGLSKSKDDEYKSVIEEIMITLRRYEE